MKRMWLPAGVTITPYPLMSPSQLLTDETVDYFAGWVDVEAFPQLEHFCITEDEYKLRRLMGKL